MTNTELIGILKKRFEENITRHKNIEWTKVQERLEKNPDKLWSLGEMERTGGEPDVVFYDETTGEFVFYDCCTESPAGRRNICYDGKAEEERKKKGVIMSGNALDMAAAMKIELLGEEEYRRLQERGEFDLKTSSWLKTPDETRKLGGAIFGDRRYNRVFIYHNSAPSFYGARGFRGCVRI